MKFSAFCYIFAMLVLLNACAANTPIVDTTVARKAAFPNQPFKETLRVGYLEMSDMESKVGDKEDAARYARKAVALTHGIEPELESLYNRNIKLKDLNELLGDKYFIESAFANGVKYIVPEESANAQVMFDCLLEQIEEGAYNEKYTKFCRDELATSKYAINAVLSDRRRLEQTSQQQMEAQLKEKFLKKLAKQRVELRKMPDPLFIFFRFNSVELGITGRNILKKVAEDIKLFKPGKLVISGHADKVGSKSYNLKIAMRRGQVIANYLVEKFGINPSLLDVKAYGENKPREESSERKKDVRNRYVEIIFLKDNRIYSAEDGEAYYTKNDE